jgi:hypothetical protein
MVRAPVFIDADAGTVTMPGGKVTKVGKNTAYQLLLRHDQLLADKEAAKKAGRKWVPGFSGGD